MEGLRWLHGQITSTHQPCSRCQASGCPWDYLAGKPVCPDCQELLARGEGEPLIERAERSPCVICQEIGVLRLQTVPLNGPGPLEIDLCGSHLQALLRRRLDRIAFGELSTRLGELGVRPNEIFLLHEAFYDELGHPLQPVPELY